MTDVMKQAILSVVRSALIALGTVITANGVVDEAMVKEVIGLIMTALPILWGIVDKYLAEGKTAEREAVALNAGIAAVNAASANLPPVHPDDAPKVISMYGKGEKQ